jgi:hypothetical protein
MSEAPREIMAGTGQGLLEFYDRAAERGDMNASTAKGGRAAAKKVLSAESEDLSSIQLRDLDIDDLLGRFAQLNRAEFSDGSLNTYRSRFRLGVEMYLAWLDNDPNWKRPGRPAKGAARGPAGAGARPAARRPKEREGKPAEADPSPAAASFTHMSGVKVMSYDVPLRRDLVVRLTLPVDLTDLDAQRLTNFVNALAFSGTPVPEASPDGEGG